MQLNCSCAERDATLNTIDDKAASWWFPGRQIHEDLVYSFETHRFVIMQEQFSISLGSAVFEKCARCPSPTTGLSLFSSHQVYITVVKNLTDVALDFP